MLTDFLSQTDFFSSHESLSLHQRRKDGIVLYKSRYGSTSLYAEWIADVLRTKALPRNELHESLNRLHDEGNGWIDSVIQSFELVKLAQEAIKYGSPSVRQSVRKALASNYPVNNGKLVWDWASPFRGVTNHGLY